MPRRHPVGLMAAVAAVAMTVLIPAGPAAADPAGPTDYRTDIVGIEPATDTIALAILGGDSFVELAVEPGTQVEVVGYRGEPYLRFDGDGTVWQNERSSSRWLNDDRLGEAEIPPEADDDAEPDWVTVADDGVYAWHDHRAHWMNSARPIGAEPGDTILEAVIPLEVDGRPVVVEVRSQLLAAPSPVPAGAGALLAAAGGLAAIARWRGRASVDDARSGAASGPGPVPSGVLLAVVGWAVLATIAGASAVFGLPAEAAPGPTWWLLPLVAVVVGLAARYLARPGRLAAPLGAMVVPAALALAGVELLLWAWLRREALTRALIPTIAPEWADRAVVAGAATMGLVALTAAAIAIRERRPAPRPTP